MPDFASGLTPADEYIVPGADFHAECLEPFRRWRVHTALNAATRAWPTCLRRRLPGRPAAGNQTFCAAYVVEDGALYSRLHYCSDV